VWPAVDRWLNVAWREGRRGRLAPINNRRKLDTRRPVSAITTGVTACSTQDRVRMAAARTWHWHFLCCRCFLHLTLLSVNVKPREFLVKMYSGGAENDGHENDGPSKLQGMKLQVMKLQDMTRIDSILFNFSFFMYYDADVPAMELCNVIMKWIFRKRSNDRLHVTSLRVELCEQVTSPTILICNINNKRLKFVAAANNFLQYSV